VVKHGVPYLRSVFMIFCAYEVEEPTPGKDLLVMYISDVLQKKKDQLYAMGLTKLVY